MDVEFRALLAGFVLTAIAGIIAQLLPPVKELRSLALLLDFVPFVVVAAATIIAAARLKHASLSLIRLLIAIYGYFAGALIGTFGLAHLVAVVTVAIDRLLQNQFVYGFRFYSLVLFGVLLIVAGLMATVETTRLAQGQHAASRASLAIWTVILAINLPLVSLQGFAVLFSVVAALELLLLASIRRPFEVRAP